MDDSIENSPEFKAYFNSLRLAQIAATFRLNLPDHNNDKPKFVQTADGFIYVYESDINAQATKLKIHFKQAADYKIIKLDLIFLPPEYQNQKQGLVILARTLNLAFELKVNRIELSALADIDIQAFGSYYWAAIGAEPLPTDINQHNNQDYYPHYQVAISSEIKTLLHKYTIYRKNKGLNTSALAEIKTLYDLSQHGRKNLISRRWPGKDFLIAQSWSGGWDLHDPMQIRHSYSLINNRLQNLLIDITLKRNNLFSDEEIVSLLDKSKEIEEYYKKREHNILTSLNAPQRLYKHFESSAFNRASVFVITQIVKQLSKKTQVDISQTYPTLADNFKQIHIIIKTMNKKYRPGSHIHSKLTALAIERSLGKTVLDSLTKQYKTQAKQLER